jgi:ubiquinone/menaquinone biosynthesis C-methylase UbiE
MNVYERRVLPWLIHLAMRTKAATVERADIVPLAAGIVLEIGVGSGLNLPFYGPAVEHLYALDPSPVLLAMAKRRAVRMTVPVGWIEGSAEAIPLEDQLADTVVTTWTLCTMADPARALREMRRVLKCGGRLLFIEHGRAPEADVRAWQDRLTPLWRRIAGGCHLNRPIDALLRTGGFELQALSTGYGAGPRPFEYLFRGVARPAEDQPERRGAASHRRAATEDLRHVG